MKPRIGRLVRARDLLPGQDLAASDGYIWTITRVEIVGKMVALTLVNEASPMPAARRGILQAFGTAQMLRVVPTAGSVSGDTAVSL